jgi:type IV pilus assembly protein PilA
MFRRFKKSFRYGEKGFTMIELLVAIALLGVLAAVAIPNLGKFIGQGKTESYAAELHNIQTGTMAMLVDSTTGELDEVYPTATDDMKTIQADSGTLQLNSYLVGLTSNGTIKTGCTYSFTKDGTVTQTIPTP